MYSDQNDILSSERQHDININGMILRVNIKFTLFQIQFQTK